MKKKLTILVIEDTIGNYFVKELKNLFENTIDIDFFTPNMVNKPYIYNTDLILYTDPSILVEMMEYIKCNAPTIMMKRTISKQSMNKLRNLEEGKSAYVANINSFMANETLATIYSLGIKSVKLYPLYENSDNNKIVDYIITPHELNCIKKSDGKIIDIGNRLFDMSTILDIIAYLNIERKLADRIIKRYTLKIPSSWKGLRNTLYDRKMLSSHLDVVLNEFDNGVLLSDENGLVILSNNKAAHILDTKKEYLEEDYISNIVNRNSAFNILFSKEEVSDEIIDFKNKKLIVTIKKIIYDDVCFGKLIVFKYYNDLLKTQQKIHNKLIGKGYYSKYTFDNIIGNHPDLIEAIEISKRVSNSSSSILLTGESGTGKELFAGAIHNYSDRNDKPFIAINCATLPETLLETELFGYDEGAFTGARKGGKIGVFEKANEGTLFLDEIGEMPLNLQARLLRALQEKQIMHVGGDAIINVNVRIIAATNKNLFNMVKEGLFRNDLFYRLNIFMIEIPVLRDRKSDIHTLTKYFLKQLGDNRKIDKSFNKFCLDYDWPGNIRELKNIIEYMIKISENPLSIDNLPKYLKKQNSYYLSNIYDEELLFLKILKTRKNKALGTGRRSIHLDFNKNYYKISEKKIRDLITELEESGLIKVNKGRKGCELTEKGNEKLEKKHNLS